MFKQSLIRNGEFVPLRCLAFERSGQYVATCLDLCLSAQGDTPQEAKAKLHDQVVDFLIDALHENDLQTRPAPLSQWLQYFLAKGGIHIRHHIDGLVEIFSENVRRDALTT